MMFYNIKKNNEKVTFFQALLQGLGTHQGLFFPEDLPKFSKFEINNFLEMNFVERSAHLLSIYIGEELSYKNISSCVSNAFNFPIPLVSLNNEIAVLELFHGPTLAFKDFGSRLMAQMLHRFQDRYSNKPMIILTATSGDTGAAVADAFYGLHNIYVIVLYPKGKISIFQEKLFCTLGNNVYPISVDGDFDTCQSLVKQMFEDNKLKKNFHLNSANSINIIRILGQICYYFEAMSRLSFDMHNKVVFSVPSGNFGNLTAGLLAQFSGLPIKRFIIATNSNDTVPRFLESGCWNPIPAVSTLSNAMDVSCPSNWVRIEELFYREKRSIQELGYGCVDDKMTRKTIRDLEYLKYISDPHTAVAYRLLRDQLKVNEFGICLGTAHPAKFKELVESCLENKRLVLLPVTLEKRMKLPIFSYKTSSCFFELRNLVLKLLC